MLYKADIFYILIRKWGKFKVTDVPKHHASKVQGMKVKLHRFLNLAFGECEQWFSYSYQFIIHPSAETNSNLKSVRQNTL